MALNEIYKYANELPFEVADTVVSGDLVQVGELVGVAQMDAYEAEDGNFYTTLKLDGAFKFETAGTFSVGDPAYFDGTDVTDVNTDKLLGHVVALPAADEVVVRLVQSA